MTDATPPSPPPFGRPIEPAPRPPATVPDLVSLSFYKMVLIGGLALATIVPNLLITNLVEERETRQDGVRKEFTRSWGPERNVYSPTLVIPYQAGDRPRQYVKIAPTRLDLTATLDPQERKRGLFHATVYDAKLDMSGSFLVPAEARLRDAVADKDGRFIWNEAMMAFGAAENLTGMRSTDNIVVNNAEQQWVSCLEALRQEPACRGARFMLAGAPLAPRSPATRASSSNRR